MLSYQDKSELNFQYCSLSRSWGIASDGGVISEDTNDKLVISIKNYNSYLGTPFPTSALFLYVTDAARTMKIWSPILPNDCEEYAIFDWNYFFSRNSKEGLITSCGADSHLLIHKDEAIILIYWWDHNKQCDNIILYCSHLLFDNVCIGLVFILN